MGSGSCLHQNPALPGSSRCSLTGQPRERCSPKSWAGGPAGQGPSAAGGLWTSLSCLPSALQQFLLKPLCLRAALRSLWSFPASRERWEWGAQRAQLCLGSAGLRGCSGVSGGAHRGLREPSCAWAVQGSQGALLGLRGLRGLRAQLCLGGLCCPTPQPRWSQRSVLCTDCEKGIIYVSCIFLGLTAKNGKRHWGTLVLGGAAPEGQPEPPALPILSREGLGVLLWGISAHKALKFQCSPFFPEVLLIKNPNLPFSSVQWIKIAAVL